MIQSGRELSIPYQIGYTENLLRNNLNRDFNKNGVDITPEQMLILDILIEKPKGTSMHNISEIIHRDNSAVTRSIDSLEKKKCVKRTSTEIDRRKKLIIITSQGMEIYIKARNIAHQHIEKSMKNLTEKQITELFKSLKIIQENNIKIKRSTLVVT